jgi:hypothetical protein
MSIGATPGTLDVMIARAVEDAENRLRDLRHEAWDDGLLAVGAVGLALTATALRPDFAVPLFIGGMFLAFRAIVAEWRRWDLIDRLAGEHAAHVIPEVRARAERDAGMASRRSMSRAISWRLELGENPRIAAAADELAALANDLLDSRLDLDPACAAVCSRLLADDAASPLINPALPLEDLPSRVAQIRAGFHRRPEALAWPASAGRAS